MEKRAVLAIVLSLVVVVLWSIFLRQHLHRPLRYLNPLRVRARHPLVLELPSRQPQSAQGPGALAARPQGLLLSQKCS